MKITPLEIRQKTFDKSMRGFDKDEVAAFLLSLSHQWERMLDENKTLKREQNKLEQEVQKLREVENVLFRTLKMAENTSANVVDQANKTASLHLKETQISCDSLIGNAKNKAKMMIERAEVEVRSIMEEMHDEVKNLQENYRTIANQRDNVISQFKLISSELMAKVENVKSQELGIEVHLNKVKQLRREASERVSDSANESKSQIDAMQIDPKVVLKPTVEKEEQLEDLPRVSSEEMAMAVKKNYISGNMPIIKTTATKTKPPKMTATKNNVLEPLHTNNGEEISFFDQLER